MTKLDCGWYWFAILLCGISGGFVRVDSVPFAVTFGLMAIVTGMQATRGLK